MPASEPSPTPAAAPQAAVPRADRALWAVGVVAAMGLAIALWSQAGREVFAAMMSGLLALCF